MVASQITAVGCTSAAHVQKFLPYLNETIAKYEILAPAAQLCFLAQVSHESGGFYYTEELASGAAYEGRKDLGNVNAGDGIKYKGRGLIQVTGRTNYQAVGEALNVDFINNPTLLGGRNADLCTADQLRYATLSAGWFWHRTALNDIASRIDIRKPIDQDENFIHFKEITRKINGGFNGLADRLNKYKAGLKQFISAIAKN
jgi:putative chitinase